MRLLFMFSVWSLGLASLSASSAYGTPVRILFLGDSLTAGYGIAQDQAYPALIEQKAAEAGFEVNIINAGMSGDTSAGGLRRLPWVLRNHIDIAVVALGANDGLRGLPTTELQLNLEKIIDTIREKYPDSKVILAGMSLPFNMGKEYIRAFEAVFPLVAKEKGTKLIPFLLEGVAGNDELNQSDRIHPTVEGQKVIAATVWRYIEPELSAPVNQN